MGCHVIGLEVGRYEDLLASEFIKNKPHNEVHYAYIRKGILMAQAIIVEVSVDKFRLGYEAALAAVFNKPILCISMNKDYSTKIMHPEFYAEKYRSISDIEQILQKFINKIKKKNFSVRFHGYITPKQKNFLDWYSKRINKNASEIIRELLDKKISEVTDDIDNLPLNEKDQLEF